MSIITEIRSTKREIFCTLNSSFLSFPTCSSWLKGPASFFAMSLSHTNAYSPQKWKILPSSSQDWVCLQCPSSTSSHVSFDNWPRFCIHGSQCSLFPLGPWEVCPVEVGWHLTVLPKCIPQNQVSPAALCSCWCLLYFEQAVPVAFCFSDC